MDKPRQIRDGLDAKTRPIPICVGREDVRPFECVAIRALEADGWTLKSIAFVLERREETINHHANGKCDHDLFPPREYFEEKIEQFDGH